jgi:prevent-host-death family protein
MNHVVNMQEAKARLSDLVALTQQGEDVTICDHGKPVAKLVAIKPARVFGLMKDKWPQLPLSAFAPMSDEEAAEWGL